LRSMSQDRRAFLKTLAGWSVSLCGVVLWAYFLSLFRLRRNSHKERKRLAVPGLALSFSHTGRRNEVTRERLKRHPQWQDKNMILNRKHGVVHWPHPALFRARYKRPEDQHPFSPVTWADVLGTNAYLATGVGYCKRSECDPNSGAPKKEDGVHFHFGQEPRVRETLALSKIEVDRDFNFSNLDTALKILLPAIQRRSAREAFESSRLRGHNAHTPGLRDYPGSSRTHKRESRPESRFFLLYARLVCLQHEHEPKVAQQEIAKLANVDPELIDIPFGKDFEHMPSPPTLFMPASQRGIFNCANFECWHQKTVERHAKHNVFRRKLARRIIVAREITGVGSSSGKDPLRGEWSSNLQPDSLHYTHRRSWLSRQRKRARRKLRSISKKFRPRLSRRQKHDMSSD
jgi:hypothetical protein